MLTAHFVCLMCIGVFKALAALLQFAFSVFESLVDDDKYSSDTAGETKPITNYLKHMRKTAAVMVSVPPALPIVRHMC